MKFTIKGEKVTQLSVRCYGGLNFAQVGNSRRIKVGDALDKRERFKAFAHFVQERQLVSVQSDDTCAFVRFDLCEALGGKNSKGFADWLSADAELFGDLFLANAFVRLVLAIKNHDAESRCNLLGYRQTCIIVVAHAKANGS